MTDKLKATLMNKPSFAPGEQPTAQKMNASFDQVSFALQRLERAFGDITDYDGVNRRLASVPMHTPNVGRAVGPSFAIQDALNAKEEFEFSGTLELGRNQWTLPFKPFSTNGAALYAISTNGAVDDRGSSVFVTDVTPLHPTSAGQYCYDEDLNAVISFLPLQSGTATFVGTSYLAAEVENNNSLPFFSKGHPTKELNVIPPPDISPALNIVRPSTSPDIGFQYLFEIGQTTPHWRSPISDNARDRISHSNLLSIGLNVKGVDGFSRFPDTTEPVQFRLPYAISTFASGAVLPSGALYVYNVGASSAIVDGTYHARDATSFYYSGAPINTAATSRWAVVCAGAANLGETVEALRFDMVHHRHDGAQAINHGDLKNIGWNAIDTTIGTAITGIGVASRAGGWRRPTYPTFHDHPQYLLRYGWDGGADAENLGNVMQGHLFIGASDTDARSQTYAHIVDCTATSWKLFFGNINNNMGVERFSGNPSSDPIFRHNYINKAEGPATVGLQGCAGVSVLGRSGFATVAVATSTAVDIRADADVISVVNSYSGNVESYGGVSAVLATNAVRFDVNAILRSGSVLAVRTSTEVKIDVLGSCQAALVSGATQSIEIVSTNFPGTNFTQNNLGALPGKYVYYDNYIVDARRKRQKFISPFECRAMNTSAGSTDLAIPRDGDNVQQVYSVSTNAGLVILDGAYSVAAPIGMPANCILGPIEYSLQYQEADLEIYAHYINGSSQLQTTVTLPALNGSATVGTYTPSVDMITRGDRYGAGTDAAVDYTIHVKNNATSLSGINMRVRGFWVTYYEMRS